MNETSLETTTAVIAECCGSSPAPKTGEITSGALTGIRTANKPYDPGGSMAGAIMQRFMLRHDPVSSMASWFQLTMVVP